MADLSANQIPVYAITPFTASATLAAATAGALGANTNAQTVYTAPSAGARIYSLIATSTDTAARDLWIQIQSSGGTVRPVANIAIPANSGNTAGTLAVNCLNPAVAVGLPVDNTGKSYIELGNGDLLIVSVIATMTAAKNIYVTAMGATYV